MRCSFFCVANGIDLSLLSKYLRQNNILHHPYSDVIHVPNLFLGTDVFYFANGTVVMWNVRKQNLPQALELVEKFCQQKTSTVERDFLSYRIGDTTNIKPHEYFNVEMLSLENNDADLKLALSFGFSQSIKLQMYQRSVERLVDQNASLINELAEKGKIRLSVKDISRSIGKIFSAKSLVNFKSEYLNPPKFFWQHPNLETYYVMLERYLDLSKRAAGLNQKLDILNEMFDMFNSQLQHRHSYFLEMAILILIGFEVIFSFWHF